MTDPISTFTNTSAYKDFENVIHNMSNTYTYVSIPVIYAFNGLHYVIVNALVWTANLWTTFCKIWTTICKIWTAFCENEFVQKIALNMLWLWSGTCLKVEQWFRQLYDENYSIRLYADHIYNVYEQLVRLFERRLREPECDSWINVCTTKYNAGNNDTTYFETYRILKTLCQDELKQSFVDAFTGVSPFDTNENQSCRDTIIVMKMADAYTVRLCKLGNNVGGNDGVGNNNIPNLDIVESSYGLLSVTYSNPKMSEQIMLNIPKEMYLVGNQLFSPAFVYRLLAYQNKRFEFDLNYTIHLIDNNINQFQLNSREYLTVGEDDGLVSQIQ